MEDQHLITELARAIQCAATGDGQGARAIVRQLAGSSSQAALPGIPAPADHGAGFRRYAMHKEQAIQIFRYWQIECGHTAAKPTPERLSKVLQRLKDGYTVAEVMRAIDGAKHGAFEHEGKRYDDLELICRNGVKLEDFIARGERHLGPVVVEVAEPIGGLEQQIADMRRKMAALQREGRAVEYEAHAKDLKALMAKRGG